MPRNQTQNSFSITVGRLLGVAALLLLGGEHASSHASVKFEGGLQSNGVPVGRVIPRSPPSAEATLAKGAACDRSLQSLVEVLGARGPVEVRTDLSLSQIEELASRIGHRGKHRPFGFYSSTFNYTVDVDLPATAGGLARG